MQQPDPLTHRRELLTAPACPHPPGAIAKVIELHVEMPPADVVEMYAAMCRFTHAVYSEQQDKGDQVGEGRGLTGLSGGMLLHRQRCAGGAA